MRQIFHHYKEWEDYKSGAWRNVGKQETNILIAKCIEFTGNHELYGAAMVRVIKEWPTTRVQVAAQK